MDAFRVSRNIFLVLLLFLPALVFGITVPCQSTVSEDKFASKKIFSARDENFTVFAPSQEIADEVLKKANEFRVEVALKWLGKKLDNGEGQTIIQVKLSNSNIGNTWIKNPPRNKHVVEILATRERLNAILAHEIAHTIFLTKFELKLPAWTDEGIACLQEDEESFRTRCRIAKNSVQMINRSRIENLFNAGDVPGEIQGNDSIAMSLVQFFLTLGGEKNLIKFSLDGKKDGWDKALSDHYKIRNIDELQHQWQNWVIKK
ncbi:MAG: hypothetical protein AAB847_01250 [Patescibacteria group bacterium]